MKTISKTVLAFYLLALLWLVLFKFSYDLGSVLLGHQMRSLSLVPFSEYSRGNLREMIDNLVVFVPFGLLLSVNFKRLGLWQRLALTAGFSLTVEIVQYVLAIGISDTTDLIMNTAGGLVGLALYDMAIKYIHSEKIDRFIVILGAILLVLLMVVRVFVVRVRY